MRVKLISLDAWSSRRKIVFGSLPMTIGRSPDAGVPLDDRWVSRRHCEIDQVGGTLVVRDSGSTHGTFVNGARVAEARLMPGDKLGIGMSSFEVQYKPGRQQPLVHSGAQEARQR
jgi:pSer/pThr/pTyr-binding forkhead associated (FHA) protein